MTFRYARHTTDLTRIENFYTEIVGLENLGSFENHDNYNGLFLGYKNTDWHLEFTTSDEPPNSKFDEDDLLVFYVNSAIELSKVKEKLQRKGVSCEQPKNPYWSANGVMIADPDNYKVVIAIKPLQFSSKDDLTRLVQAQSIENWSELMDFIQNIPYGRNANRNDFSLILKEKKGTCSSKHGFLKKIAEANGFHHINLILGIYKMNHLNTPQIDDVLLKNGLKYIPEAHCYLKINNLYIDITHPNSRIEKVRNDIVEEIEIEAEQVDTFKVEYHKDYIRNWMKIENISLNFNEIWKIREECIQKIEENSLCAE